MTAGESINGINNHVFPAKPVSTTRPYFPSTPRTTTRNGEGADERKNEKKMRTDMTNTHTNTQNTKQIDDKRVESMLPVPKIHESTYTRNDQLG